MAEVGEALPWKWGAALVAVLAAANTAAQLPAPGPMPVRPHDHGAAHAHPEHPDPGLDRAAVTDPRVQRMLRDPQRLAALDAGEAALRLGDPMAAQAAFERASSLLHAADSEMGLVRAAMQAGRYRDAAVFCAHTAGAHRESVAPAALYATLLAAGGQKVAAAGVLAQARERAPDDALLKQAQALVKSGFGVPTPEMLRAPHRMAPLPVMPGGQAAPPVTAAVRGGAVLLADGRHALAPLTLVEGQSRLWVRDGLGRAVPARVERRDATGGVALLALAPGLQAPGLDYAAGAPRAGRPGYAIAQAPQATSALPAWPWLFRGFVGRVAAQDGSQELGIGVPAAANGVVLMDAEGRVAGMGLRDAAGEVKVVPVAGWAKDAPAAAVQAQPVMSSPLPPTVAMDEVYEWSLRVSLQLIAAR